MLSWALWASPTQICKDAQYTPLNKCQLTVWGPWLSSWGTASLWRWPWRDVIMERSSAATLLMSEKHRHKAESCDKHKVMWRDLESITSLILALSYCWWPKTTQFRVNGNIPMCERGTWNCVNWLDDDDWCLRAPSIDLSWASHENDLTSGHWYTKKSRDIQVVGTIGII